MAFKPNRARAAASGPTCATCAGPVTLDEIPGPRWQAEQWLTPDTTHNPNGSPLTCAACARAELRERFRSR